jgi:hypothetical protein
MAEYGRAMVRGPTVLERFTPWYEDIHLMVCVWDEADGHVFLNAEVDSSGYTEDLETICFARGGATPFFSSGPTSLAERRAVADDDGSLAEDMMGFIPIVGGWRLRVRVMGVHMVTGAMALLYDSHIDARLAVIETGLSDGQFLLQVLTDPAFLRCKRCLGRVSVRVAFTLCTDAGQESNPDAQWQSADGGERPFDLCDVTFTNAHEFDVTEIKAVLRSIFDI